jgi:hydroxymethylpyrimidine pyrophosphatase-like HAD family hydrolase
MLEAVEYPFAMESGKEGIKEICPYHTDNVEKIIRKILDGEFPSVSKDAE